MMIFKGPPYLQSQPVLILITKPPRPPDPISPEGGSHTPNNNEELD